MLTLGGIGKTPPAPIFPAKYPCNLCTSAFLFLWRVSTIEHFPSKKTELKSSKPKQNSNSRSVDSSTLFSDKQHLFPRLSQTTQTRNSPISADERCWFQCLKCRLQVLFSSAIAPHRHNRQSLSAKCYSEVHWSQKHGDQSISGREIYIKLTLAITGFQLLAKFGLELKCFDGKNNFIGDLLVYHEAIPCGLQLVLKEDKRPCMLFLFDSFTALPIWKVSPALEEFVRFYSLALLQVCHESVMQASFTRSFIWIRYVVDN